MTSPAPGALDIARALIACRSVTPADAGALPYLEGLLRAAGFRTELVTFSAPGTPDVLNLYARYGDAAPNFVFAGHTDVVPSGEAAKWRFDPFGAEIADSKLWGRGAADMKGGVAASVAAALRFIARGAFKGSISLLITGDEEGPAVNGTVKLLEWARGRGERFDHCDCDWQRRLFLGSANLADMLFGNIETMFNPLEPLVVYLAAMGQDNRWLLLLCNDGEAHDCLARSGRSDKNSAFCGRTCLDCPLLKIK